MIVHLPPQFMVYIMQAWWYFGVENVIQELNSDPEYVAAKRGAIREQATNQFYMADEAARLNTWCGGRFLDDDQVCSILYCWLIIYIHLLCSALLIY